MIVDSATLAKCIYNNGCTAEQELTLPAYIQSGHTLSISSDSDCSKLNDVNKKWIVVEIGDSLCNNMTTIELSGWSRLEQIIIGSGSFTAITSISMGKK